MAQVDITVNGRVYPVACGDGEEAHLAELGRMVDARVAELSTAVGQIGDSKLLVMASLLIADQLSELQRQNETLQTAALAAPEPVAETSAAEDEVIAQGLEAIAERIEGIADRLEHN